MDKAIKSVVRKVAHIPKNEPVTLLRLPGTHSCPLAGEEGTTNCPLGFSETRKPPSDAQPWMRGTCENDTWRDRWREILASCQHCRGNPKLTPRETQTWSEICEILTGGKK